MEVRRSWRLNERHYGALQGRNKAQAAVEDGAALVDEWRRSWDVSPPPMTPDHPHWSGIYDDPRYADASPNELPRGESLAACARRLEPFWTSDVAPAVRSGLTVLVVGHANSLRALLRIVFRRQVTEAQIRALKVPTGVPLIYHLDERPCEADESDFCALGLGAEPDWELVPRPPPPGCAPRGRFLYPLDECPVAYDDASAPHFYLG